MGSVVHDKFQVLDGFRGLQIAPGGPSVEIGGNCVKFHLALGLELAAGCPGGPDQLISTAKRGWARR